MRENYDFYYTQDGSIGLYSYEFDDVFHSKFGALTEAWTKFVIPSGIDKLINKQENINVLDICYGVGYNTKALMSYVINYDEKYLRKIKFSQKLKIVLKNIFLKNKKIKNAKKQNYVESKYSDNLSSENDSLSQYNETIYNDNETIDYNIRKHISKKNKQKNFIETIDEKEIISKINIDCLESSENFIKISPFLKTVFTPQEIYDKIVPKIFDCSDLYWVIRKKLAKFTLKIALQNRKEITEMLDLKYKNDYDLLKSEYKIHKYVNYIIANKLLDYYKDDYFNKKLKFILREKRFRRFFDKSMIKYARFMQKFRYNFMSNLNLLAFLHNIYYHNISIRYKKTDFKAAYSLFNINFYKNDARNSILQINRPYDLIFLDAFTCSKAPELWSVEFFAQLYKHLAPSGVVLTYSTSALVRNTFIENKFYVGKIVDKETGKAIGTIAAKDKSKIEIPLTNYEYGLCNTRAGIPYHDYSLSNEKEIILRRRENEFRTSELPTSSQYMRSRTSKKEEIEDDEW